MSKKRVKWDEKAALAINARRHLPVVVGRYFALVRELLSQEPTPAELHTARLATKQLRYTLELFRACYGPGLETRLSELRELQQLLGEVNDHAATSRMLSKAMRASAQRTRTVKFLERRAVEKADEFCKHWHDFFDAAGRERWWTSYLQHQAKP